MANVVGKISGPLLESNLLREGIDLSFDTDLIYLDVNDRQVGININVAPYLPIRDLDIKGVLSTTNLIIDTEFQIPNFEISGNTITNIDDNISLSAVQPGGKITANRLQAGQIEFDNNTISSLESNSDIDLSTSGFGQVHVYNELDVQGNLHASGNIVADGNLVFGDSDTDNVVFNADIGSNLFPDLTDTFSIGDPAKRFSDLYTYLVNGQNFISGGAIVGGIDLSVRPGNTWYVSTNGNNTNVGDHPNGPFATIEYALSQATLGDTVLIYSGTYMENFPLTVPVGVTVKGEGIRAVKIIPQASSNDQDAFLLNGETTVSDLTIADFFYNNITNTGYAFKFANNITVSSRSPYIQNISVITENESSLATAGRGAYIDGSVANAASKEASMLFHSATFITPGADCIVMKNGVRVEWLNSFIYFANKGLYAENGSLGFANLGLQFGAEVRSIGSANVYGNYGAWADGNETLMYLINHNFAYIGSGVDADNDPTTVIQANEVVKLNSGKIYYQSVDHKGDFRVGDVLLIEQETGAITFTTTSITGTSLTVTDGTNTTYVDAQEVQTGNIQITGNNINSLINEINFTTQNNTILVPSNLIVGNFNSLNFTNDNNVIIGSNTSNLLNINATINDNLIPTTPTQDLGSYTKYWRNLYAQRLIFPDIKVDGNAITTTQSNSDLELRANGTGKIEFNDNTLIEQNLYNYGTSTFFSASMSDTLTLNGPLVITNYSVAEFDNGQILIRDNFITTTESNSNLELRAQGIGGIILDDTLKITNSTISNNLLAGTSIQRSIIFSPTVNKIVDISANTAIKIPNGTNINRTLLTGELRFNNVNQLFEGSLSNITLPLSNLYDSDKDTFITAELSTGFNDNVIRMFANGINVVEVNNDRVRANRLIVDELRFDNNTIQTFTSNADIELQTSGSGILNVNNNFDIDTGSITNPNSGAVTSIVSSTAGYVKFTGTGTVRIPVGTNAERPVGVSIGATRYNTDQQYLEVYNGTSWVISTGGGIAVTPEVMEDLGDIYALIFG